MTNVRMTGALVSSCQGCPYNRYYSGNAHQCLKFDHAILPPNWNEHLPAWCPLPVYPQHEVARLEAEVRSLQEFVRNERGQNFWLTFCHLLSNYLGIKFDPLIYPLYCTLVTDNKVVLVWERVESLTLSPFTIVFHWQGPDDKESKTYRLEVPVSKTLYGYGGGAILAPILSVRRLMTTPLGDRETWDEVHGFPPKPKEVPPPEIDPKSG